MGKKNKDFTVHSVIEVNQLPRLFLYEEAIFRSDFNTLGCKIKDLMLVLN